MTRTAVSPPEVFFRAPLDYDDVRKSAAGPLHLMPIIGRIEDEAHNVSDGTFCPHSFNILADCVEFQGKITSADEDSSNRWALVTVSRPEAGFYRRIINGLLGKHEVDVAVHYLPNIY